MRYMKPVSRAIFCLPKSICECAHGISHIYRQEPWLSTAKALKFVLLVFCSGKLKFSKNPASNNLNHAYKTIAKYCSINSTENKAVCF